MSKPVCPFGSADGRERVNSIETGPMRQASTLLGKLCDYLNIAAAHCEITVNLLADYIISTAGNSDCFSLHVPRKKGKAIQSSKDQSV